MKILILVVLLCSNALGSLSDPLGSGDFAYPQRALNGIRPRQIVQQLTWDIEEGRLPHVVDKALDMLIHTGAARLRAEGFDAEANQLETEYETNYQNFIEKLSRERDIGDHPSQALSTWLDIAYAVLEAKLGLSTCKLLHLTDIKVINDSVKIVIHPCTFPMDFVTDTRMEEYACHFANSPHYGSALVPVVVYWVVQITCSAASMGAGWFFICSPLAMAGEFIMDSWIAPKLSDSLFTRQCGS